MAKTVKSAKKISTRRKATRLHATEHTSKTKKKSTILAVVDKDTKTYKPFQDAFEANTPDVIRKSQEANIAQAKLFLGEAFYNYIISQDWTATEVSDVAPKMPEYLIRQYDTTPSEYDTEYEAARKKEILDVKKYLEKFDTIAKKAFLEKLKKQEQLKLSEMTVWNRLVYRLRKLFKGLNNAKQK